MEETIGKRIQSLLIQKSLSQQELADKVNKHQSTIFRIINGDTAPNKSTVHLIANALNSSFSYLQHGIGPAQIQKETVEMHKFDPATDTLYNELKDQISFLREMIRDMKPKSTANFPIPLNQTGPRKNGRLRDAA